MCMTIYTMGNIVWSFFYRDLEEASASGDLASVKRFLEKGSHQRSTNIDFALWAASKKGHLDIVKILVEKCSDKVCLELAMMFAAYEGHGNVVSFLLETGAEKYNFALDGAACGGHMNIVELMLEQGANNYQEAYDRTEDKDIKTLMLAYMGKKTKI